MAKRATARPSLEELLQRVHEARERLPDPAAVATLRGLLETAPPRVVVAAAKVAAKAEISELTGALVTAFDRFLHDPVATDPSCTAKLAIVEALVGLGYLGLELYRRGARHVQMEPAWGKPVDSAAGVRAVCARALVQFGDPAALDVLADHLADPEWPVREAAAASVGDKGDPAGVPLLRLKLRIGDGEAPVITAALEALLHLDAEGGRELALELLRGRDELTRECAALVLGEKRLSGVLPALIAWCERVADTEQRAIALLSIAMLRTREAHAYLLEMVATGTGMEARDAIKALATFKDDPAVAAAVMEAAERNEVSAIRAAALAAFG